VVAPSAFGKARSPPPHRPPGGLDAGLERGAGSGGGAEDQTGFHGSREQQRATGDGRWAMSVVVSSPRVRRR
jgi:hypothetical protein